LGEKTVITIPGMGLTPMVPDIAHDPMAIGLFNAISVVVIPQDLSNLIREPEFRIWSEFFEFSMLTTISCNRWNLFHILYIVMIIAGIFSMIYK
jgi:hypothetical protein